MDIIISNNSDSPIYEQIEELMEQAADRARLAGISLAELEERLRILYGEEEPESR